MFSFHTHSVFSMLTATNTIDELVGRAKELNLNALAITDINGMYGAIQFYKKASEEGIKPIIGVYIDEPKDSKKYVLFIPRNRAGYSELCKIITSRKLKEDFSLAKLLSKSMPNMYIISPSIELLSCTPLGGNIFAELIVTEKHKAQTRKIYEFAKQKRIKYVTTNPVYFMKEGDFLLHKVVSAIRLRKVLANLSDDDIVDSEFYFKDSDELDSVWARVPNAIKYFNEIVSGVNLDLEIGKVKFPIFPVPNNESSFSFLWKIAFEGLEKRYNTISKEAVTRLKYELDVIDELGFADYFLVVWDIVREAKQRGMMILGRGSAGNSLVSYALGFTEVDPIKYNLYFERFLNRSRSSPPDVDLDFSWRERDYIVKYVFDKYGYDHVAMISTTVTFRARSAFRETAKVFGLSDEEISQFSKFIPWTDARNLPNIASLYPESKSVRFDVEPWKSIVSIAARLGGFPRHLSIHPGGIVISPTPITNFTALEYAKNKGVGLIITQPDMYPIEDLGLIKIDLLSQRALGVLRETMDRISIAKTG